MNIRGIELMRTMGYAAPRREILLSLAPHQGFLHPKEIDLDYLFEGAAEDAAIIAFDYSESIRQQQFREKDAHAYPVSRDIFFDRIEALIGTMRERGAALENVTFITHQAYSKRSIVMAGKAQLSRLADGYDLFFVDATKGFRAANTDAHAEYSFQCPLVGTRFLTSMASSTLSLPQQLLQTLMRAIRPFAGLDPLLDFEIHREWGLFYHDLSLNAEQPL